MSIDFSVRGEGPALVLIHGLFGTRENLGAIAKQLAEDFKVYSIDLPNHGRSKQTASFSLGTMARDVEKWMTDQALTSANFFGHSLGGKVAMELALTFPDRVDKLIVADIAPVAYGHRHEDVFEGLLAIDLAKIDSRVTADRIMSESVNEKPVRSFLLKNIQRDSEGKFSWRMNLHAIHSCYPDLISANLRSQFEKPALFLKADNSDYITEEHREEIVTRFPEVELKVVANTGHWLHAEKPDLIARLARRFFLN